ncbi:hypothetical protein MLD52_11150 [Puniceicoccaceae bacterium K14]|nr:hypothetical protein [Puniceicoccaceae bacterium K14]
MYKQIDISSGWSLFSQDLDMGLFGHLGRAYQRDYVPEDAIEVSLPVTAPAAYLSAGKIEDPYFGMNSRDITWMEKKEWWYLKDFDLPRTDGQYRISFQGVNYRAEAWLNDVQIGVWEGSFINQKIDLDPALLLEKGNRLAIRVRAQERAWEDGTQPDPRGFQNSSAHIRTQRPTPQFAYGWNWSPHMIAVGIWRPVILEWMESARFEETRIDSKLSDDFKTGEISFEGEVKNLTSKKLDAEVQVTITGPKKTKIVETVPVKAIGKGRIKKLSAKVTLSNPALWYPNGFGSQPLYKVDVKLIVDGKVCDSRERKQGIRKIEFIQNTNAEAVQAESGQTNRMWSIVGKPYPWTMVVNGVRIFSKGSNWCPVDNLYRNRDAHVRRQLELSRDAHYVFMRVWGGGLTESDHFYDCCDEMGIVCLQEFWFACGSAPAMDYKIFLDNAASEIKRLRERTSIGLWGGGNEFNPDNHENRPIINLIDDLVDELDGTREFRRGSPYRGDRHGGLVSTPYRTTNKYRDLLPGRKRLVLLRSECAVGRSPTRPSNIKKFMPEDSLWPIDWKVYQNHHAQKPEWMTITKPFGKAQEWEQELIHSSVFHCIDSRLNMEHARASKYESSGCWTWQINASWPSFHREHVDWYGDPKPVYYWYKNACKPVITMVDLERFVYHPGEKLNPEIYAVNDTHKKVSVSVDIKVITVEGKLVHTESHTAKIGEDDRTLIGRLGAVVPENLAEQALYISVNTTQGKDIVHRNTYYVAISPDTQFKTGQEIGNDLTLKYIGNTYKVSAPHYYTLAEIVDEPTEHDKATKSAEGSQLDAVYSKTFDLEASLVGKNLELYLPGFSAEDSVYVNGKLVGSGTLDPKKDRNYEADPLIWPTLPVRHYAVPADVIKETGNVLEVKLTGRNIADQTDKRFGMTEMIYIREATVKATQKKILSYNKKQEFFASISQGAPARVAISTEATKGGFAVTVKNTGKRSAAFLVLDVEGEGDARFVYDEGALSGLHAGESVTVNLKIEGDLKKGAKALVRGLNIKKKSVKLG